MIPVCERVGGQDGHFFLAVWILWMWDGEVGDHL